MGGGYSAPVINSKHYDSVVDTLPSLDGKVVAVTGTTSGTGYAFSKTMAQKGAKVVMLNRPSERSTNALAQLKEEVPDGDFDAIDCDLQDFASVRAAAKQLKEQYASSGVDVLCNNAGVMALEDKATKDGFDVQMQTNHLSHFLLTKEMMPLLETAAEARGEARVVNHSSIARKGGKLEAKYFGPGGDLGGNGSGMFMNGPRWIRYHQTKLANAVFTYALHDRLTAKNSKVKSLVAHPGVSATQLQVTTSKDGGMGGFTTRQFMKFSQSIEDGALGIIMCAATQDVESGSFFGPGGGMTAFAGKPVLIPKEDLCDNQKGKDLLWEESCKAIGETWDL